MYSFRVNLFSRADRNPFFMLSLLPPQPTHHADSPGKHHRNKNCNLPVLNKKSFCQQVTGIFLLQIDLPAAGFFTSPALQKPTSAVLRALCRECTRGLAARERSSTEIPAAAPAQRQRLEKLGCKKVWNSIVTPLEPYSLQIKRLLNQINSNSLLYMHGFHSEKVNSFFQLSKLIRSLRKNLPPATLTEKGSLQFLFFKGRTHQKSLPE